jgi:segregation and condensation protein B
MTRKSMKAALEAMMFTWGELLPVKTAAEVFNEDWKEVYDCLLELKEEYEQQARGLRIREVDKAFQLVTSSDYGDYIERLCTPVKKRKLSQSALEVLAIVAYRQPVTKGEIDSIRGIKSDRVMEGLLNKELVKEVGRTNGIGRPILYGTTQEFLKHFGFSSVKDLPEIEDIELAIHVEEGEKEPDPRQIRIQWTPEEEGKPEKDI